MRLSLKGEARGLAWGRFLCGVKEMGSRARTSSNCGYLGTRSERNGDKQHESFKVFGDKLSQPSIDRTWG